VSLELVKATLAFFGALLGAVCGAYFKAWFDAKQAERRLRSEQQQKLLRPLAEAATTLRERLETLVGIYRNQRPELPFSPESLSSDFRELYMLSPDPVDLGTSEGNVPRGDPRAVQRLRTRMAHNLNYAASSLYFTARYLGWAKRVSRGLKDGSLVLADNSRREANDLLKSVCHALQGQNGAGIPWEEQESIAEVIWNGNDVITYPEFRRLLLESPGWEQLMGLFRFFVDFKPKLDYEVSETAKALSALEKGIDSR
jgi:hypothetical protein